MPVGLAPFLPGSVNAALRLRGSLTSTSEFSQRCSSRGKLRSASSAGFLPFSFIFFCACFVAACSGFPRFLFCFVPGADRSFYFITASWAAPKSTFVFINASAAVPNSAYVSPALRAVRRRRHRQTKVSFRYSTSLPPKTPGQKAAH